MTYADGRYGALDIGTVTCRLLVADVEDGRIIDVDKEYACLLYTSDAADEL